MSTTTIALNGYGAYADHETVEDAVPADKVDAYREALNTALDGTTIALHLNDFYVHGDAAPDAAAELITAALASIDASEL